jgi:hypothetical protein
MDRAAIGCFLLAALLASAAPAAAEPVDAAKRRDIEDLLRVVRWDPGRDSVPEIIAALRKGCPQVTESEWGEIERAAREVPGPMERMIALHARLYTADESARSSRSIARPSGRSTW